MKFDEQQDNSITVQPVVTVMTFGIPGLSPFVIIRP